ncbi:hypothetical protein J5J01_26040 [Streptomyces fradiae]|uniref:hypothetical protein n=1 Tax=Streptomyces fradiae TaxID=1906 RepID=UPI0020184649|nr:hypothetical protein [Streptomyces fradiae]UQS30238.1 hypothetical protein J5J01_26040 [Streptomyces fradiae]
MVVDTGTVDSIGLCDERGRRASRCHRVPGGSDRRVVGEVLLACWACARCLPRALWWHCSAAVPVSFAQLYALNHLCQDMVDGTGAVRGQANTAQSYKTVVELVLGLIDAEMRVLAARRDDLSQTVSQFKRRTETISEFLTGSAAELEEELTRSRSEEQQTHTPLEELQGRMRAATTFADPLRRRVAAPEATHSTRAREEEKAAQAALSLAQRAITRAQRQPGTDPVLRCPSCTHLLTGRIVPQGACGLCLCELDPGARDEAAQAAEAALATARQRAVEAAKATGETGDALALAGRSGPAWRSGSWPGRSGCSQPPHAGARTRAGMLERSPTRTGGCSTRYRQLCELQRTLRSAVEELRGVREAFKTRENLPSGRQATLVEIEEQFAAIIGSLSLPGEPGARIDRPSLLP